MFQTVIEMHRHNHWHVYSRVAESVDALLAGKAASGQLRKQLHGKMIVTVQSACNQSAITSRQGDKNSGRWVDNLFHTSKHMAG